MDLELKGTRALVTGGSRGIGRAVVELLAKEGCEVEFCARDAARVNAVQAEFTGKGFAVRGSAVDMSDQLVIVDWCHEATTRLGGLDLLVSNASAMATGDSNEAWRLNYQVEIAGLRTMLSVATPHLQESAARRGDAAVVAVASTSASRTDKLDAYGATKAALIHAVKGLSHVLIEDGIRANTVSPGPVYSPHGLWEKIKADRPSYFEGKIAEIPLGRMGTPEEVANVVVFLCSTRARYIVGSNVIMDGGRSHRPLY